MFLEKFSLPLFANREIEDLNYFKRFYDSIDTLNDKRVNKIKKKKEILSSTFEILSGLFDLKYDLKLRFDSLEDTEDTMYLNNIDNLSYNEIFNILFDKCFKKYLNGIYLSSNGVEEGVYNVVSLALLNNHDKIISDLTTVIYDELINNQLFEKSFYRNRRDVVYSDLKELPIRNNERNKLLRETMKGYEISDDLSYGQLRIIYACFSNNVFNTLNKEEKIHLMNLLYNYHTYDELYNFESMYRENITSKEAITMVIDKLMLPGRTMIIKRKNMDIINDVLSGKNIIYKNEIEKKYLNTLEDLKELVNKNIR